MFEPVMITNVFHWICLWGFLRNNKKSKKNLKKLFQLNQMGGGLELKQILNLTQKWKEEKNRLSPKKNNL